MATERINGRERAFGGARCRTIRDPASDGSPEPAKAPAARDPVSSRLLLRPVQGGEITGPGVETESSFPIDGIRGKEHETPMLVSTILVMLSFGLLFLGAEWLVRGGGGLALRLGLTPLVVGLTVVAYGTSAPELLVSLKAAWSGQPGIAVGNVIGSNIFNIAVILGVAALIRPVKVESVVIRRDAPVMIGATLAGLAVLWDGRVTRWEGGLLVAASAAYTFWIVAQARKEGADGTDSPQAMPTARALFFLAGGLLVLVIGSQLLVGNAVVLARGFGVSEAIIGLTVVAAGTSMPELATSAVGALRGQSDIALGNVIGSNIFNLLFVMGLSAVVHPIDGEVLRGVDQVFLLGTAIVLMPMLATGRLVSRKEGALLLVGYALYLTLMWPKG